MHVYDPVCQHDFPGHESGPEFSYLDTESVVYCAASNMHACVHLAIYPVTNCTIACQRDFQMHKAVPA